MNEVDPASVEVEYDVRVPDDVRQHLERVAALRGEATKAQDEASREVRAAARELRARGLPLRDVGQVLGVSYQRRHQLLR